MSVFVVFNKNLLHCSCRLAKGGGYEKRHGYAALFLLGSELSTPEKMHQVELKSRLQKLLNGLRRFNLFQSQWIISDQFEGRET